MSLMTLFLSTTLMSFSAQAKEVKEMDLAKLMAIKRPADLHFSKGPAENFTGEVRVAMVAQGERPSEIGCAFVTFEKSARSSWHTHPKGQLLIVTEGSGLIQQEGQPIQRLQKGDLVWTPPGVKHWHGGSPESSMTHIAIQEALNGKPVQWMAKVTNEEYQKPFVVPY